MIWLLLGTTFYLVARMKNKTRTIKEKQVAIKSGEGGVYRQQFIINNIKWLCKVRNIPAKHKFEVMDLYKKDTMYTVKFRNSSVAVSPLINALDMLIL